MPCQVIKTDESVVFMCSRGPKPRQTCSFCTKEATYLCDYRVAPEKPCDVPMCGKHRRHIVEGIDFCETHRYAETKMKRPVFGEG